MLIPAVLMLAVVIGGALFTRAMSRYGEAEAKRSLAHVALTAAATLDPETVSRLAGGPQDNGSAALHQLRAALARIHAVNGDSRFVYLMRRRVDGHWIFLADAEPETSPDYSPPGQLYEETIGGLLRVLATGEPIIEDPYHDSYGEWVSALAPVRAPSGGPVVAVLGMDISTLRWQATVLRYRVFGLATSALIASLVGLGLFGLQRQRLFGQRVAGLNRELKAELAERRRAEQELRLAAAVLANTSEAVMVTDAQSIIRSVNPAFEHITGYRGAEVVGRSTRTLYARENDRDLYARIIADLQHAGRWQGEIWSRRKNGERYPQEVSISALRDNSGETTHYASIFRDNTAQRQLEDQLSEMASLDGLTGLANRRFFDDTLGREWGRALREQRPLSLLMADLDYFKAYNDRHGHVEGDDCLRQVGGVLKSVARRPSDLAARYGGEEFALILPLTDIGGARTMAERLCAAVREAALRHEDSPLGLVTISVGHATILPHPGLSAEDLLGQADRALYRAKRDGRNCVRGAEPAAVTPPAAAPPAPPTAGSAAPPSARNAP